MRPSRSTVTAAAAGGLLALAVGAAAVLTGAVATADSTPSPGASAGQGTADSDRRIPGQGGPGQRGAYGHGPGQFGDRGPGGRGFGGVLGGGFLHGEIVVQKADGSGTETLLVQAGSVTAKTGDSVTVKSTDGFSVTWAIGTATNLADLAVGDQVHVVGSKTSSGGTARTIMERRARTAGTTDGDRRTATPSPKASPTT